MGVLRSRKVSMWVVLLLLILLAVMCFIAISLFREVHPEKLTEMEGGILGELAKTIFIAIMVGVAVEVYLKWLEHDEEAKLTEKQAVETLQRSQIQNLYPSRNDAKDIFKQLVEDSRIKIIYIAGISLREFLRGDGRMRLVWDAIWKRMQNEKNADVEDSQRLRVRILLLDPMSSEGRFRFKVEERMVGNLERPHDIEQALDELERAKKFIFDGKPQDFLQARLYGHCPFSFVFATEFTMFVEQYYYREDEMETSAPVMEYQASSDRYKLFKKSLEIIWKNAHSERIAVGTAMPIEKADIRNIFRENHRQKLAERQLKCVEVVAKGSIDILAISGRHYVNNKDISDMLLKVSSPQDPSKDVVVRMAILNPVSQQAIFRAVADDRPVGEIRDALCSWNWGEHRRSKLYTDISQTMKRVGAWRKKNHKIELRLYSSAVACALMLTPNCAFVEQYIYGRTKKLQETDFLIGEYPVIEYGLLDSDEKDKVEHEIITSTFQIVWDCYSIPYEDYASRTEHESEFNKNLVALQEELNCMIQTTHANIDNAPERLPSGEPPGEQR